MLKLSRKGISLPELMIASAILLVLLIFGGGAIGKMVTAFSKETAKSADEGDLESTIEKMALMAKVTPRNAISVGNNVVAFQKIGKVEGDTVQYSPIFSVVWYKEGRLYSGIFAEDAVKVSGIEIKSGEPTKVSPYELERLVMQTPTSKKTKQVDKFQMSQANENTLLVEYELSEEDRKSTAETVRVRLGGIL